MRTGKEAEHGKSYLIEKKDDKPDASKPETQNKGSLIFSKKNRIKLLIIIYFLKNEPKNELHKRFAGADSQIPLRCHDGRESKTKQRLGRLHGPNRWP
jgi:hypothetical protein